MIELLYAVIIVFGSSLIAYFIFPTFQYMKIYLYSFQVLIWILLISLNQYKNHYLWDEPDFNSIHELPYPPINDIEIIYDSNNNVNDIKVAYSNKVYSLIETEEYSKKCIDNYFIPQSETCPITDIIIEYSDLNIHSDYEKIEISNGYIYYRRDFEEGKFYDSVRIDNACSNKYILFDNKYKSIKFSYSFDYQDIKILRRLEENKILKPFKNFKNYKNTTDLICLFISIFSWIYCLMGNTDNHKWNYFKVIDNVLQFILFILYLVRFILFGKVKTFFKENEDLYNDKYLQFDRTIYFVNYFPKKMSINSFPLALSIVIIFFLFLSLVVRNKKCSAFEGNSDNDDYNCFDKEKMGRILMLSLPFIIIYFICFILDIINDEKIKKIYKNTIDNWDTNPIISIGKNSEQNYELGHIFLEKKEFNFYSWKYSLLEIKRDLNYNYMNIYFNNGSDNKICGTDNFGKPLYFPQNVECPINDIFISKDDSINDPDYTKINLGLNNYLYYTNKKTDKNILIDIKVGFPGVPLELSTEKTNELYSSIYDKGFYQELDGKSRQYFKFNTVPFYKEIDHWDLYDFVEMNLGVNNINYNYIGEISLYSLTYQGFNSTSNEVNFNILKYKRKMDSFIKLSIAKSVFSSFNLIFFLIFSIILFNDYTKDDNVVCPLAVLFAMFITNFIIVIICFSYNIIYVQNIMNRINNDFERNKNSYTWILSTFILNIIFLAYYLVIFLRTFKIKYEDCFCCKKNNNSNENKSKKTSKNTNEENKTNKTKKTNKNKKNNNNSNNVNTTNNNKNDNNTNSNINNPSNNKNDSIVKKIEENKNINIEEEKICIICRKEKPNITFGCGHMCYCSTCFNKEEIKNKKECPTCKYEIKFSTGIINVKNK